MKYRLFKKNDIIHHFAVLTDSVTSFGYEMLFMLRDLIR